ncbi:MAG TPA: 50S ribosomal protein L28 [Candidatus Faecenecus gallistercoris]|uniref:50S ribosomal protein L28 n=1 Tax=Candidatus Faecenecus gallistercoris TaxID=2840793 RepID=A0A9D1CKZ4_9FIRM|nr:50S ribosomal protein L28 [Bacillota bacterium]MDY4051152.1 bL28 family ribosomal protein [Candidatus Faecenecus gallistercoris]CDE08987.1 50S ribosomal protein L28 [Bacillus sp. CAG:988]MDD7101967.1 bL28 family ribosomal protein [Bacillota bacterium]PWL69595.1 MAG: 50S ribosomal protein L28 [Bacillota bacterium]
MAVNVSERKPSFGNRRSHSLRATRHKQKLNLQTVRLEDGSKVRMTTKEIKTQRKNVKAA